MSAVTDNVKAMSQKLQEGWTLTGQSCPNPNCITALMRNKAGQIYCVNCRMYAVKESDVVDGKVPAAVSARFPTSDKPHDHDHEHDHGRGQDAKAAVYEHAAKAAAGADDEEGEEETDDERRRRQAKSRALAGTAGKLLSLSDSPQYSDLLQQLQKSLAEDEKEMAPVYDRLRTGAADSTTPAPAPASASAASASASASSTASTASASGASYSAEDDAGSSVKAQPARAQPVDPLVRSHIRRHEQASARLGEKLLQGWAMLAQTCTQPNCGAPLMRDRSGVVHCVNCEADKAQAVNGAPVATSVSAPTSAANSGPQSPASSSPSSRVKSPQNNGRQAKSSTLPAALRPPVVRSSSHPAASPPGQHPHRTVEFEDEVEQPLDEATIQERMRRSEQASARMGEKLLQGWALLAEHCPNPRCYCALMRDKQGKMHCVSCGAQVVREGEYDPEKHGPLLVPPAAGHGLQLGSRPGTPSTPAPPVAGAALPPLAPSSRPHSANVPPRPASALALPSPSASSSAYSTPTRPATASAASNPRAVASASTSPKHVPSKRSTALSPVAEGYRPPSAADDMQPEYAEGPSGDQFADEVQDGESKQSMIDEDELDAERQERASFGKGPATRRRGYSTSALSAPRLRVSLTLPQTNAGSRTVSSAGTRASRQGSMTSLTDDGLSLTATSSPRGSPLIGQGFLYGDEGLQPSPATAPASPVFAATPSASASASASLLHRRARLTLPEPADRGFASPFLSPVATPVHSRQPPVHAQSTASAQSTPGGGPRVPHTPPSTPLATGLISRPLSRASSLYAPTLAGASAGAIGALLNTPQSMSAAASPRPSVSGPPPSLPSVPPSRSASMTSLPSTTSSNGPNAPHTPAPTPLHGAGAHHALSTSALALGLAPLALRERSSSAVDLSLPLGPPLIEHNQVSPTRPRERERRPDAPTSEVLESTYELLLHKLDTARSMLAATADVEQCSALAKLITELATAMAAIQRL